MCTLIYGMVRVALELPCACTGHCEYTKAATVPCSHVVLPVVCFLHKCSTLEWCPSKVTWMARCGPTTAWEQCTRQWRTTARLKSALSRFVWPTIQHISYLYAWGRATLPEQATTGMCFDSCLDHESYFGLMWSNHLHSLPPTQWWCKCNLWLPDELPTAFETAL